MLFNADMSFFKIFLTEKRAFTLIEVLVGSFLISIVFLGIFGAFQLYFKVIEQSKNQIIATNVARGELEKIKNLPYESIGIINGILPTPAGILEPVSIIVRNNTNFIIERKIKYIIDEADGIGESCPNDYKRAEIKASWSGRAEGQVVLVTDVSPKTLVQECAVKGGVLTTSVFDAYGQMVESPLIEIFDFSTGQLIDKVSPVSGEYSFPLSAGTYKVAVSKDGFSQERTYNVDEITTPAKPHPLILENQHTEISFAIDRVAAFTLETLSPFGVEVFSDSFLNADKISEMTDVLIDNGEIILKKTNGDYKTSGQATSIEIQPTDLIRWEKFSFSDLEPTGTEVFYQLFYFNEGNWDLIPDEALSGNFSGFGQSPIDLSELDIVKYQKIKLKANLSTTDVSISPSVFDWQISWVKEEPTLIPNISFNLRGEKIIGTDSGGEAVYKYSKNHTTNANGSESISNLEWDNYFFSVDPQTGLDLIDTNPGPQPISLFPNQSLDAKLYLKAENSLLVIVQDLNSLEPVFSAKIRLYNLSLGKDIVLYTNEKGQAYFMPLAAANYNLDIGAAGYSSGSGQVFVSGDIIKTINLEQIE